MTNPGVGMPCPVCAVPLVMSERQGVEIDYCPQCRGVWLDRGELDKIIERSAGFDAQAAAPTQGLAPRAPAPLGEKPKNDQYYRDHDYDDDDYRRQYPPNQYPPGQYPPKKKKNFLEEMFDVFD